MTIFWILAVLFRWLGGEQLKYKFVREEQFETTASIGELADGTEIRQEFTTNLHTLSSVSLSFTNYGRATEGFLSFTVSDAMTGENYASRLILAEEIPENSWYDITFEREISDIRGRKLILSIVGNCPAGAAPSVYYNEAAAGSSNILYKNGIECPGELGLVVYGKHFFAFYPYYWQGAILLSLLFAAYMLRTWHSMKRGKPDVTVTIYQLWLRYKFLIRQLVGRDFKTKYKRSVLGYLWSFLNPVLTMLVQYAVFSTLFRSDIKNFPVYLLSGTVFFSFFTEAVGQGLTAIVGNAALITKVYVPKYIYPMTRVLSSSINLVLSLIPLLLLALFTKSPVNATLLLLIVPVCSLLLFCMGMALLLSAAMVFFRDTQYLWGIVSLAWTYATPLFYPESILPDGMRAFLKLNPMYYIVTFVRSVLIDGVSPEPFVYLACIGFAILFFVLGALVFRRHQNKFILYI